MEEVESLMKIVACIPFRNEEVFLPICLTSLQGVADEILGYDDGSTDNSVQIFESFGGLVKSSGSSESWSAGGEGVVRNTLLQWGRERGATHSIWLDADEALTSNFRAIARERIAALPMGHKLSLQLLALWKSSQVYRDDASVWSNLFGDFVVCDDVSVKGYEGYIHTGRTQGEDTAENWHKIPLDEGAVLHFQFCAWRQFQMKQCWYRCTELVRKLNSIEFINTRYAISLDDSQTRCNSVLPAWIEGLPIPENLAHLPPAWQFPAILAMFAKHGVRYFEPLQIWHVPELHEIFVNEVGREPRSPEAFVPLLVKMKRKLKSVLPEYIKIILRRIRTKFV